MTLKRGRGLEREELEVELETEQAETLWPLAVARSIHKTRYVLPDGTGRLELDVYEGALTGLITVEREFVDVPEAQAWTPPEWAGRDVTQDGRYTNAQLAIAGRPAETSST